MIDESAFIEYRRQLGKKLHLHDGVWWEEQRPFYCKPAFEFRPFPAGTSKPAFHRSFLGYSHQVPVPSQGTRFLEFMVLEGDDLRNFGMAPLRAEKRNQVRKGLKLCQVRLLDELEPYLETMRQINITQATRQGRWDTPAEYYIDHADAWRTEIRTYYGQPGREWWGAFADDKLVAYMITSQVGSLRFIEVMKSHTDALKLCPTDAVYFTVLEAASRDHSCMRIINGGPARESLNHYKEQFLFKRQAVPYYTSNITLYRAARMAASWRDRLAERFSAAKRTP